MSLVTLLMSLMSVVVVNLLLGLFHYIHVLDATLQHKIFLEVSHLLNNTQDFAEARAQQKTLPPAPPGADGPRRREGLV